MAREIQIQIPKLIAAGSTNRRSNCERVALDLSGRNNALFTYHFPDFPIIMTQLSQIMWLPLHKGCPQLQVAAFTRNQFNYDTHNSHRDYKPPPTPTPSRLSLRLLHILLGNDNTLDPFHTSASEELPVISTRQSRAHLHNHNQSLPPQPVQRSDHPHRAQHTHTHAHTYTLCAARGCAFYCCRSSINNLRF